MIILFDGVCNLCSGTVNFIIDHDPSKKFRFASLQSTFGEEFLKKHNLPVESCDSFVLIDGENYFIKSTAALLVARHLSGFWKCFYVCILVPAVIRDFVYSYIAKNRYKWFGKRESCRMPEKNIQDRFL
ncbi:MAG: thiol-disulfide oxidoreductase DCC family protein [Leptospiraceae bacterium]|nr:thiol-disulfide oxidoreductase DCC family protein [Leptospiraceae bacterium]